MPRSVAEVNAIRRSNRALAETGASEAPAAAGNGRHGYDPNQPRVPAGHSDGGQWTSGSEGESPAGPNRKVVIDETGEEAWESVTSSYRSDGTLAEQEVIGRDASRIHSQFSRDPRIAGWDERHTVVLPDGRQLTFEQSGVVLTTYDADGRPIGSSAWTADGPEPLPRVQPAFLGVIPPTVATSIELALILGIWLASRNGPGGTAAVSFPANAYQPNPDPYKRFEPVWVGRLTDDELGKVCPKYGDVQRYTDKAAADARRERTNWRPSGFGTEVHKRVAREVNGKEPDTNDFRRPDGPMDPNFRAEFSALKAEAAAKADPYTPSARYGQRDTVRVDVLENRPNEKTVCVYDIKTGERVLLAARTKEILGAVFEHYKDTQRIMITEIRPHL